VPDADRRCRDVDFLEGSHESHRCVTMRNHITSLTGVMEEKIGIFKSLTGVAIDHDVLIG